MQSRHVRNLRGRSLVGRKIGEQGKKERGREAGTTKDKDQPWSGEVGFEAEEQREEANKEAVGRP